MIAKLSGILDATGEDWAVVEVGGVGYLVFCSGRTLADLPRPRGRVQLLIETHVREDHIHLYGFAARAEQDWFRLLTTVQGVGARVALAILTVVPAQGLAAAIAAQDKAPLTSASGVGAKLAQRILSELKDKASALAPAGVVVPLAGADGDQGPAVDAVSALVNIGYARTDAFGAISTASRALGDEATIEALITNGLKELAP